MTLEQTQRLATLYQDLVRQTKLELDRAIGDTNREINAIFAADSPRPSARVLPFRK